MLLKSLGFIVNGNKSVASPTQQIEFLGFKIDSHTMTLSLPTQKWSSLMSSAKHIRSKEEVTIRELSQLLGQMVAAHPANLPAPLYYRQIEKLKLSYLRQGYSFDHMMPISHGIKEDLSWWVTQAGSYNGRPLQITHWDVTIESDASMSGWGASCQGENTGGPWMAAERTHHINYLELKAAFLALQSFCSNRSSISVLLRLDNITAIAFINRMGGSHSYLLSDLTAQIWNWCISREITIHAEHLPGVENIQADWESRHQMDSSDWKLDRNVFISLVERLGPFSIDLFASRTNAQLPLYCSWRAEPAAVSVDALSIPWTSHYPYMFPPFPLISRCLGKLNRERVSAVMIAPVWPNQPWFPQLLNSLNGMPILLPPLPEIVTNAAGQNHPLVMEDRLPLAAWPVSGDQEKQEAFLNELSTSLNNLGEQPLKHHTPVLGDSGIAGVLKGVLIHFQHL